MTGLSRLAAVFLLAAFPAGCGGGPLALDDGAGGPSAGGAPSAELDAAVVGSWRREAFVTDGVGAVHGVTTTWSFLADGVVKRRLVTDDVLGGVTSEMVAIGSWTSTGVGSAGTLTLTFTTPATTVLRLPYQVTADDQGVALVLDGLTYRRHDR